MSDGETPRDGIGSVGEEAAKLLGALQDWARDSGGDYAEAASGLVEGAAASLDSLNEHIATGGQDCRYCPLCRAIAAARATSPEVRQHLIAAGSSLLQAASAAISTDTAASATEQEPVEKIGLTDSDDWDD